MGRIQITLGRTDYKRTRIGQIGGQYEVSFRGYYVTVEFK